MQAEAGWPPFPIILTVPGIIGCPILLPFFWGEDGPRAVFLPLSGDLHFHNRTLWPDELGMAWSGDSAGAMAVEQLLRVCLRGKRIGPGERVGCAEAEVSATDRFPLLRLRPGLETRETRAHGQSPSRYI